VPDFGHPHTHLHDNHLVVNGVPDLRRDVSVDEAGVGGRATIGTVSPTPEPLL
jgi:hypothetical protein